MIMSFLQKNWQKINFILFAIIIFFSIGYSENSPIVSIVLATISPIFIIIGRLDNYKEG